MSSEEDEAATSSSKGNRASSVTANGREDAVGTTTGATATTANELRFCGPRGNLVSLHKNANSVPNPRNRVDEIDWSEGASCSKDREPMRFERQNVFEGIECDLQKCHSVGRRAVPFHCHTQRPKSVSFHTGSSLPLERKVSNALDCLRYMINGSSLIKIRASSRQYRRFFTLEEDFSALRWVPSSKKSSKARLSVRCIKEVRMGRSTDVLRNKDIAWAYSEDCAFSIFYNDNFESLDLIASTPEEANIWVTGLNLLIGASKSPDTFDERQKMREKWLREVFDEADTDQKGLLNECETISLMKKLNNQLSTVRLRQKIMEFEHGKMGEERGRIDSSDFINIFKETSTRPEIYFLLVRFSGKDYMSIEDFLLFLEGEQGMTNMDVDKCLKIIKEFEPSEEAKKNKQLLIDGFTSFLLSQSCDIMDPVQKSVCQNMASPFAHYFISSSHNTYLLEDQLKGPSGIEGYITALKMGCRCVKVDCHDGLDGPVVYHGNTLTSKILMRDVLEAIKAYAFHSSQYPLIIHLENHCSLSGQELVAQLLINVLGDMLYLPLRDGSLRIMEVTPEMLKRKILVKGKKLPSNCHDSSGEVSDEDEDQDCVTSRDVLKKIKLSQALSDVVSITRMMFWSVDLAEDITKLCDVSSFSEYMISRLCQSFSEEFVNHNKQYLTHVFPNSSRVDSSNFNPLDYWSCGCQMVAMNFQTAGHLMDLYQGWFQQNGGCGYTLKPPFLREQLYMFYGGNAKEPVPGLEPTSLYIKVISAQQLPQPKGASSKASAIDPYVVVQVYGLPADCAEARTRTVSNEGHSPIFDESFEFTIAVPELAMLRISVLDDEFIGDDFIGQYSIPLLCLQTGYRHLRLLSHNGDLLFNTTVFVYISIATRSEQQKSKRKKAWLVLKNVGLKQADAMFKSAAAPLAEAHKMRVDEEQAMLDLCKECGLAENANLVQCLRVVSFRMATNTGVANFEIISENEYPKILVSGEVTVCLGKAISLLEKVFSECKNIKENAGETLKTLTELYHIGESIWKEMANSSLNLGNKGRKAEKAAENFLWNMTILSVQTELLKNIRDHCCTLMHQLKHLGPVFSKIFRKERESMSASGNSAALTPVLSNQLNLMPSPFQQPVTPTSPGADGRLRGILKKTTPSTPPIAMCSHGEGASSSSAVAAASSTVFFPISPIDNNSKR